MKAGISALLRACNIMKTRLLRAVASFSLQSRSAETTLSSSLLAESVLESINRRLILHRRRANGFIMLQALKFIVISCLVAIIFWPTFGWLKDRFMEADTYYSHGFLVPLISLFLIYRNKEELLRTPSSSDSRGIFILLGGLLLHLAAFRWGINFICGFAFIIVLSGLCLVLWGREITKKNIFPILFLLFMIPLPKVLIIEISFKLKILAAQAAANTVNFFGIPALRTGSTIQLPNAALTIGDPCSGLRSLIALLSLGALYAYISSLTKAGKMILFFASIPIALIANIIRIILLLFVAYVYGSEVATGKFHNISGLMVFIIALFGLMLVGRLLSWQKKV